MLSTSRRVPARAEEKATSDRFSFLFPLSLVLPPVHSGNSSSEWQSFTRNAITPQGRSRSENKQRELAISATPLKLYVLSTKTVQRRVCHGAMVSGSLWPNPKLKFSIKFDGERQLLTHHLTITTLPLRRTPCRISGTVLLYSPLGDAQFVSSG